MSPEQTIAQRRGRRYAMPVVLRARALHEATWTYTQIKKLIEVEFDVSPAAKTIERWCLEHNAKVMDKRRTYQREWQRAKRAKNRRIDQDRSPAWRLERMHEMRRLGVSYKAIGIVAGLWWGDSLTGREVEAKLSGKRAYRRTAEAMA